MITINKKLFLGILLSLVVFVSSSVSYITAMGWRPNFSPKIEMKVDFSDVEIDPRTLETFFALEHDYQKEPLVNGLSIAEIALLEKIVMAEAKGEPLLGQIAVVNVILNRVKSPWYPDNVREVVYQEGQFNPTWDGSLQRVKGIDSSVKKAVHQAVNGYQAVPGNTLFFLNEEIATDFTIPNTRTFHGKIGNHSFYR
ncbi:cell wall hydrolase [Alkalicella caledoniensis]|uniref:Cell wall hydrolase n=1 Tax=Alkalicella caledoniensis TaxID=2731377 RepID=A0A7G9WBG5_ALKCA|nr:cell wall hydrolase [Alkalicella caledoniensis]QNO16027.1 cell wall hydrolase [Alkalicella caledoniensis]